MIAITAPTSSIGSQLLDDLIAGDESLRVVARDPSKLSRPVRERVEVIEGSHGDPDVIAPALAGAAALFWLAPPNPGAASLAEVYVDFARPAAEAITREGVGRVVSVSALGRSADHASDAGYVTGSLEMDDLLAETGAAFRALAMPSFTDNLLRQVALIKSRGIFTDVISPDRALPTVATRDIAAVASGLLLDSSWSEREEIAVLGPEDLSMDERAAAMADVLDVPVRYERVPDDAFTERMTGFGMTDAMAQGMLDMMRAKDRGLDEGVSRDDSNAAETPTTFRQWCEDTLRPAFDAA